MVSDMMRLGISCIVSVGSNQEWQCNNSVIVLTEMINNLKANNVNVTSISRFYQTPAFPAGAGPDFVNAAMVIRTTLPHNELLALFHRVEHDMGRVRERRWGQRTIDIDLISYGDQVLPDAATQTHWMELPLAEQMTKAPDQPIVPHPRVQDRAFVLGPLIEVYFRRSQAVSGGDLGTFLERPISATITVITLGILLWALGVGVRSALTARRTRASADV